MAVMGSIGLAIIYGFKVNVSIAILSMVNHTALRNVSMEGMEDGPFLWDKKTQGLIHSMYFTGYLISMIPSGIVAEKISARWVMNIAVLLNAIASVLSPAAANLSFGVFAGMRFIQGLGGGASFPAMHVMIAKWAPPKERNVIGSIIYAGTALGTVISILLTGLIAAELGWKAVFYIEGGLCLIWCTVWWIAIQDSPGEQKRFISTYEKAYILDALGTSGSEHHSSKKIPLGRIFTSMPFIAILVAHFCSNCGWYMLLTQLPTYMNEVLHFDLKTNAGLSSLPYFCMWIFTLILSYLLTNLQGKGTISMTISRKIGTLFASVPPMVCLVLVSYMTNATGAVVVMTIAVTCIGGMYCGFLANHIDIAPNFAGTLVALTNAVATIPGIVVPIVVGYLTSSSDPDVKLFAWKMIFFATAIFYVIEIVVYWVFGTAVEQPWNNINSYDVSDATQSLPLKQGKE
ncbi:putative inorganic phosphate cotransporter [Fopius arisanus]|uniref:Inorganic phosphate cotransporter n=1 Tax=Fopius arisanus TaxID=64838 RepID=A0A9R1TZR5_9HYME|nr:PREDICTED: putative inorganic phosphate cotransporter [Fopius arisanus]